MNKQSHSFRLSGEATAAIRSLQGDDPEVTATAVVEAALALLSMARVSGIPWSVATMATRARIQDIPAGLRVVSGVSDGQD